METDCFEIKNSDELEHLDSWKPKNLTKVMTSLNQWSVHDFSKKFQNQPPEESSVKTFGPSWFFKSWGFTFWSGADEKPLWKTCWKLIKFSKKTAATSLFLLDDLSFFQILSTNIFFGIKIQLRLRNKWYVYESVITFPKKIISWYLSGKYLWYLSWKYLWYLSGKYS